MNYYPLFINLTSSSCLIVGAGLVGQRKLSSLLKAQVQHVIVLDLLPPNESLIPFLELPNVHFEQREFQPDDIIGKTLVFAATNNAFINKKIANCCTSKNIFCNIVDAPNEGTFIVPSHIEQGGISIAISTNGNSPALSRKLRKDISNWLDNRYVHITKILTRLRPLIVTSPFSKEDNTKLFRSLVNSDLTEALNQKDRYQCEHILQRILPKQLQTHITELLHELV